MKLDLRPDTKLELAMAKVAEGKQDQLFGEYFAKVGPVVGEYGASKLCGMTVLDSNLTERPEMAVCFLWPSAKVYNDFHDDSRFKTLEPVRAGALDYLSNAHLFDAPAGDIVVDPETDYMIAVAASAPDGALLNAPLTAASPNTTYQGLRIVLTEWTAMSETFDAAVKLRVRFDT